VDGGRPEPRMRTSLPPNLTRVVPLAEDGGRNCLRHEIPLRPGFRQGEQPGSETKESRKQFCAWKPGAPGPLEAFQAVLRAEGAG